MIVAPNLREADAPRTMLDCRIDTRFSPAEYDAICRIALQHGIVSLSQLVRMAVLRYLGIPPR